MFIYILVAIVAVLFIIIIVSALFRIVTPTNEVHVIQRRKFAVPYGRGQVKGNIYYNFPHWWPIIGVTRTILPVSNFTLELKDYNSYDKEKVPFSVDIQAFFRVDEPKTASERVEDFDELKNQLYGVLQGAIRSILAQEMIVTIMEERSTFGKQFTQEVDEGLKEWGVVSVKSIELMDIQDAPGSTVITDIMNKKISKINKESRIEVAENNKEAENAEIQTQREIDIKKQEAIKLVGEKTAEQEKAVGIANQQSQQEIKEQARITAEKEMAVKQINDVRSSEIARQVALVKADEQKQTAIISAEAGKQTDIVQAEGQKQQTVTLAEGGLISEKKKAEGIAAVGSSEANVISQKEEAVVAGQIKLAETIAELKSYMEYLLGIKSVEAGEAIGTAQASALEKADLKLISTNAGKSQSGKKGFDGLLDMVSADGGVNLASMIEGFSNVTDSGLSKLFKGDSDIINKIKTAVKKDPKLIDKFKNIIGDLETTLDKK